MRKKSKSQKQTEERFYRYYGETLSCWADIEYVLAMWFAYACDSTWDTTHFFQKIFYSARSFNGAADMLKAAWYGKQRDHEYSEFFRAAIVRTQGYYEFRNKVAHHLPIYVAPQRQMILAVGNDPFFKKGHHTHRDMIVAIRNFKKLYRIWLHALPSMVPKPPLTPKQALQRIEKLPAEAHSSELSQRQRNRLRQRQLRPRSK